MHAAIRALKRRLREPLLRRLRASARYRRISYLPRDEVVACRAYVGARIRGEDTWAEVHEASRRDVPKEPVTDGAAALFASIRTLDFPGTFVAHLHGCRLYGRGVAVIGADGRVIEEGSAHIGGSAWDHAVMGRGWLGAPKKLEGTTAVLSAPAGSTYYHWLFDVLPRIHLLELAGVDLRSIDRFAVNSTARAYQRDTLAKLGIAGARTIETDRHGHLLCERMILPSYPGTSGFPPRWSCAFLRERFLEQGSTPGGRPSRIYVSRQRSTGRRVENQSELDRLLETEGLVTVYPEEHTVAEQARIFHAAQLIVAPHGSGLANLAFCEPGARLIELFPPDKLGESHYFVLSRQLGVRHDALVGERGSGSDFVIRLPNLAPVLAAS